MKVKVGKKIIGDGQPCFIIAEAGSNHNHSLSLAKKLIDVAAEAGADAVKFQSIKFSELYLPNLLPNREIKKLYPRIELQESWYKILMEHSKKRQIMFLSSITYPRAANILQKLGVEAFKIASPQAVGNFPLASHVASKKLPLFLSTGYMNYAGIKKIVNVCLKEKNKKIVLFHCVSKYPCSPAEVNLNAIARLKKSFKFPVGLSDHTLGFHITLAAVAKGANIIEKHFTLSRKLKGPDHHFALEPHGLKEMIKQLREVEQSFGDGRRDRISKTEKEIIPLIQTRLIAGRAIKQGEILKKPMLEYKRAPYGIFVSDIDKALNHKIIKPLAGQTPISWSDINKF